MTTQRKEDRMARSAPKETRGGRPAPEPPAKQADAEQPAAEQRALDRQLDLIAELLSDGEPHLRSEVGEYASQHGIPEAALGRLKSKLGVQHVRVRKGADGEGGRQVFAWLLPRDR
jgi:hypothetical protein